MDQEPQTARERAVLLLRAALVPGWLPRWLPTSGFQRLVWTIRSAIVLVIALFIFSAFDKGLWDWLRLLIVPAALALGVAGLTWAQRQREHEAEEAQQERERKAEEDRRERERVAQAAQKERELDVEKHRRQEDVLQAYLDQMTQLLLDKKLRSNSKANSEARTAARVGTLTALERIHHPDKKGIIVKFLWECCLLEKQHTVVILERANLKGADLGEAKLIGANLRKVDLGPDLRNTKSGRAKLGGAQLFDADLSGADLSNADLRGANLNDVTGLTNEQLAHQTSLLSGATMPNDQKYEEWLKSKGSGEENSGPS